MKKKITHPKRKGRSKDQKRRVKIKILKNKNEEAVLEPVKNPQINKGKNIFNLPKIKVVGVGGAGGNAITRMFDYFPRSVDLIAINTDSQDLEYCKAKKKLCIGRQVTRGLGAGMNPDLGRQAAEEDRDEISNLLSGADMIFLTSGFGGGTGSGASPVVAEIAQEMGILTIAIVTKPFSFEGHQRAQIAFEAIEKMRNKVDTLITVSNDKIFSLIDKDTSLNKAFEMIDEVLKNAVLGVTELIVSPGIINVDFADIKSIVQNAGSAIIGVGVGSGKERATVASASAINSPLLESSIEGARGVLFSISGRKDIKMSEVNEIAKVIAESVDSSAKIIFGTYYDKRLNKGQIKVTLIATGFGSSYGRSTSLFSDFDIYPKNGSMSEGKPMATHEVKVFEGEVSGLTGKDKKGEEIENGKEKEEAGELWDIPAFLRKKGKRRV